MCGIVGYVGARPALPVLLDGLARLEYRGYDSAGVAVQGDGAVIVCKRAGRVAALAEAANAAALPQARAGIGHTRWATHGRPSDVNAHPHADERLRVAVVHNGIIENHVALRDDLMARGHRFASETDSEVVAHLIDEALSPAAVRGGGTNGLAGPPLRAAVLGAVRRIEGSFALVAMAHDDPEALIGVRQHTPLVVGIGAGEYYLASDVTALLPYTRDMIALDDGQGIEVRPGGFRLFDFDGRPLPAPAPMRIAWDAASAERGGHRHFMAKEIHEQPAALAAALRSWDAQGCSGVGALLSRLASAPRVLFLGCGTAYHAALIGRHLMERWAGVPADAELASEFRYRDPLLAPGTVAVAVSQSGETADTLAAMREARARGAAVLAVANVVGSTLAREADAVLYTNAGPEIAVASTKAYTTQIAVLTMLALRTAQLRAASGGLDDGCARIGRDDVAAWTAALPRLSDWASEALALDARAAELAGRLAGRECCFFLGRGLDWALALEGQLKLKEVSYLHAEAHAAGELKHGSLALISDGTAVIALFTQPELAQKTAGNVAEVRARGARVVGIATAGRLAAAQSACDEVLELPDVPGPLAPAVAAIPLQLIAYHTAVARGNDVDRPRNLAKSVTVE